MMPPAYEPESYWSKVAERIGERETGENVIAGDDEPYYRYKRERFLALLRELQFEGENVLELGCGPGGNLLEIFELRPAELTGADISDTMLALARKKVPEKVKLVKVDGRKLPFPNKYFDIVLTATVLQHNTNEQMLQDLVAELARVSGKNLVLFERVEADVTGDELCMGRPVNYYKHMLQEHGFALVATKNVKTRCSYYLCGVIRKLLNPSTRKEGEPLTKSAIILQKLILPLTKQIDKLWNSDKDLTRMEFIRIE